MRLIYSLYLHIAELESGLQLADTDVVQRVQICSLEQCNYQRVWRGLPIFVVTKVTLNYRKHVSSAASAAEIDLDLSLSAKAMLAADKLWDFSNITPI